MRKTLHFFSIIMNIKKYIYTTYFKVLIKKTNNYKLLNTKQTYDWWLYHFYLFLNFGNNLIFGFLTYRSKLKIV